MTFLAKTPWRATFFRAIAAFVLALAVGLSSSMPAHSIENLRKYAGIVVDAKTGKVLYEEAADQRRYPASVAKVMTLYVLFQELQAGNLTLSTKMTVSKHAASAVPTKLGLRAGSTIAVEDAIKSLVTLSANDMARVIAEHISGSESKFAERMTATARAMGMRSTTYRNASGLPDGGQVTTVRDQAILGIAIFQHFPQYYEFFQTTAFRYNGKTYGNHNRVLGYMGAVDGIKTGYINAAGSNLLTAARKDNRHIVIVAFGFNSAGARDEKVRQLVSSYLTKGRRGDYQRTAMVPVPGRHGNVQVAIAQPTKPVFAMPMPLPGFRLAELVARNGAQPQQQQQQPVAVASAAAPAPVPVPQAAPADLGLQPAVQAAAILAAPTQAPTPAYPSNDIIGAWLSETYNLGAPPAALGQTAPSAPLAPAGNVGGSDQPVDLLTSGSVQTASAPVGGWIVQIGAGPSEASARAMLSDAAGKVGGLGDFRSYVERFEKNGQTFYRARFVGFGDRTDATAMCNRLKEQSLACLAMQG
ncbi:MAG: D-alanyl-D-alanine carboxypeptidase [Devosia sp.]|uniref:D-alanyl-D-alanine carboxypeptidase n=1 Tax=unclassified Devosia TaxID=196773 RepID=UPI0019F23B27|nr:MULTISPECIES: D-alanyl-D-alanine carboxypeptidase [unclassified Devosia]MBF0678373.1 D-alanyl-D-alanine carboxypeptidase [Devosia sp.]WEJ31622.1 D-alanyl-D-alanine carboxypeptidase [Devosia sp. SD17-2]